jgi:hypothetical protein
MTSIEYLRPYIHILQSSLDTSIGQILSLPNTVMSSLKSLIPLISFSSFLSIAMTFSYSPPRKNHDFCYNTSLLFLRLYFLPDSASRASSIWAYLLLTILKELFYPTT